MLDQGDKHARNCGNQRPEGRNEVQQEGQDTPKQREIHAKQPAVPIRQQKKRRLLWLDTGTVLCRHSPAG